MRYSSTLSSSCAENHAVHGGNVERGCTVLNCLGENDNQVLALEHQVSVNPRAGHARIACQVNPEVRDQQQEPTEGLSESGRNPLLLQEGEDVNCRLPHPTK